jgi:aspartate aminotransferase
MKISKRGMDLPPSPIRKLKPYADKAQKDGKTIYFLNIGQPDIETPVSMRNVLEKLDNKIIPYGPSQGLLEYQTALVKYYKKHNIDLNIEDIIVTTGGSEAIIMALTVCCDFGDEILIPEPFYTNYNGFAVATGVKINPITTRLENNWQLPSIEEIEKLITPKTKAFMICNPNNPTGKVYNEDELKKLAYLANKHDLFLLADEVYREFIFSDEKHVSLLNLPNVKDRVILMDSISKRYSACGARIGAFVSKNKEIMKSALAYAQARLCPPTIEQLMAVPSVDLDERYFQEMVGEYKARRDVVINALKEMSGVEYKIPSGAFYIVIKLPVENAEDFVIWLLTSFDINNETVMLAPAEGFYSTSKLGRDEARIAFVLNVEKTKKAMNILKEGLKKYKETH